MTIGGSTVGTAITACTGTKRQTLHDLYVKLGDLGDVAEKCARNQTLLVKPAPLTISEILGSLRSLCTMTGAGSAKRKVALMSKLIRGCRENEVRYLVRALILNMR